MFSELARQDLDALRRNGFTPTDEEVIRLNDLALAIEAGRETTAANAPRTAYAGSVMFCEPTVGAVQWWFETAKDAAWSDKGRLNTYFFMLAHARDVDYLSRLTKPSQVRREVKRWMKGVDATESEMWRALLYVKNGYRAVSDGDDAGKAFCSTVEDESVLSRMWMNVIACAGALSVTPESLRTSTNSQLVSLLVQANLHARIPMKQSVARDYIAYRLHCKAIEDRCNKEKEQAENG